MALLLTARGAGARLATFAERTFSGKLDLSGALGELPSLVARMVLPVALAAFGAALVCGLAQSRGLFTLGAFGVRRRDPARGAAARCPGGWSRRSGWRRRWRRVRSLRRWRAPMGPARPWRQRSSALSSLAPRVLALLVAGGLADLALRVVRLERSLGMSRAEQARELREEEGDPRLKAEQRRRQRAP